LFVASEFGRLGIATLLLIAGAKLTFNQRHSMEGKTPLMEALYCPLMTGLLLQWSKQHDINCIDFNGRSALDHAMDTGNKTAIINLRLCNAVAAQHNKHAEEQAYREESMNRAFHLGPANGDMTVFMKGQERRETGGDYDRELICAYQEASQIIDRFESDFVEDAEIAKSRWIGSCAEKIIRLRNEILKNHS
jgi:ankyrin repeat protein